MRKAGECLERVTALAEQLAGLCSDSPPPPCCMQALYPAHTDMSEVVMLTAQSALDDYVCYLDRTHEDLNLAHGQWRTHHYRQRRPAQQHNSIRVRPCKSEAEAMSLQ